MKFLSLFLVAVLLVSCNDKEDETKTDSVTALQFANQKFDLVKMSGSMDGTESTGEHMDWQESYLFGFDDTFEKIREVDGKTITGKGLFKVTKRNGDGLTYLELTYRTGASLAGSCEGAGKELLFYKSASELASMWNACDGPSLDYSLNLEE